MLTGWQEIGDSWYYMDGSGRMLTGWQYLNGCWYYMNGSGRMLTGWQQIGGIWYLLNDSGQMLTGWQQIGNIWYYMNSSGHMLTGWQQIGNCWYYMDGSGHMLTGLQTIGGATYYLEDSGAMAANTWKQLNGDWYHFSSGGAMDTNAWIGSYYVDETGAWDPDQEAPDYVWPCPGYTRISSDFGYRKSPTAGASTYHNGIDMAAPQGTEILSCSSGTVIAYGYNSSMGNYVKVRHSSSLVSVYMHMSSFVSGLSTGKTVQAGDVIGYVGSTGISTGPHLHFSIMENGSYINPWNYISKP